MYERILVCWTFSGLLRSQEGILMPMLGAKPSNVLLADWKKMHGIGKKYGTEQSCEDVLIQEFGLPARLLVLLLAPWTLTAADESLLKQRTGELKALLEEEVQGWKCCLQSFVNPTLGTFRVQRRQVLFIKCQLLSCHREMKNALLAAHSVCCLALHQYFMPTSNKSCFKSWRQRASSGLLTSEIRGAVPPQGSGWVGPTISTECGKQPQTAPGETAKWLPVWVEPMNENNLGSVEERICTWKKERLNACRSLTRKIKGPRPAVLSAGCLSDVQMPSQEVKVSLGLTRQLLWQILVPGFVFLAPHATASRQGQLLFAGKEDLVSQRWWRMF